MQTLRAPGHEVELVVSPLAGLKGVGGYHTSVLIGGEEYFFSPVGISSSPKITSHGSDPDMRRTVIGLSQQSGLDMLDFLTGHFLPGTYDLLRKNCNSFTDCALYFLCQQRLDWSFRILERIGQLADDRTGVVQSVSHGDYMPNPRASGFCLEAIICEIDAERHGWMDDDAAAKNEVWISDMEVFSTNDSYKRHYQSLHAPITPYTPQRSYSGEAERCSQVLHRTSSRVMRTNFFSGIQAT